MELSITIAENARHNTWTTFDFLRVGEIFQFEPGEEDVFMVIDCNNHNGCNSIKALNLRTGIAQYCGEKEGVYLMAGNLFVYDY